MWLKFHSNWRYLISQGGRSTLLGGLTVIEKSWNYGNLPYLVANTYGLNVIKIRGIWIFQCGRGEGRPLLGEVSCDLWCPFSNSDELFQSKVTCENLFQIGWAFQELSFEFSGGHKPPIRGLHVTCDAHFRTWLSYSSQKSYANIWFGLVEPFKSYRVHKHFFGGRGGGAETPIRGCYIWPVIPIFELGRAIPVKSHVLNFGLDWLKSEVC